MQCMTRGWRMGGGAYSIRIFVFCISLDVGSWGKKWIWRYLIMLGWIFERHRLGWKVRIVREIYQMNARVSGFLGFILTRRMHFNGNRWLRDTKTITCGRNVWRCKFQSEWHLILMVHGIWLGAEEKMNSFHQILKIFCLPNIASHIHGFPVCIMAEIWFLRCNLAWHANPNNSLHGNGDSLLWFWLQCSDSENSNGSSNYNGNSDFDGDSNGEILMAGAILMMATLIECDDSMDDEVISKFVLKWAKVNITE